MSTRGIRNVQIRLSASTSEMICLGRLNPYAPNEATAERVGMDGWLKFKVYGEFIRSQTSQIKLSQSEKTKHDLI